MLKKYLSDERGFAKIIVFIVLIIPITIILSLFMVIGEYWQRSTALDNLNTRFVNTINKQGVTKKSGSYYNTTDITTLLNVFYLNENSQISNLLGNAELTFYGSINNQDINGFTIEEFVNHVRINGLGRNHDRQDIVGVRIVSLNPALLDRVLRGSIGWFLYFGEEIKYKSFVIGEVQPWLE